MKKIILVTALALCTSAFAQSSQACGLDTAVTGNYSGPSIDAGAALNLDASCEGQKLHYIEFTATGDGNVTLQINGVDSNVASIVKTEFPDTYRLYTFRTDNTFGDALELGNPVQTVTLRIEGKVEITTLRSVSKR